MSFKKFHDFYRLTIGSKSLLIFCVSFMTDALDEAASYSAKAIELMHQIMLSVSSCFHHQVFIVQGVNLFSIAFRYGLGFIESWLKSNRIDAPYTIYSKQKIRLSGAKKTTSAIANKFDKRPPPIVLECEKYLISTYCRCSYTKKTHITKKRH